MSDNGECSRHPGASLSADEGIREQFAAVYDELRALARQAMAGRPNETTLQPTALVHEVCLRLMNNHELKCNDREHLLAIAAQAMRYVLKDEARRRSTARRGGQRHRVTLSEGIGASANREVDLVVLADVLDRLETYHDRHCRVVELRFFGGLSFEEIGRHLDISTRTAERDWRSARAWLACQFQEA